jgi:hypothetical protein
MRKFFFFCVLSFYLLPIFAQDQNPFNEAFQGREWEFLHYKFHVVPTKKFFKPIAYLKRILLSLGTTIVLCAPPYWHAKQLFKNYPTVKGLENVLLLNSIFPFLIFLMVFNIKMFKNLVQIYVVKFIKNWPANKEYTPSNLHPAFQYLYNLYLENGESKDFLRIVREKFIPILNQALQNRFPQGYHSFAIQMYKPLYNSPIDHSWIINQPLPLPPPLYWQPMSPITSGSLLDF